MSKGAAAAEDNVTENDGDTPNKRTLFKDLGGIGGVIEELKDAILPFCQPELFHHLGVKTMKPAVGIILHGPSGCGKTSLAHAIAYEIGKPLHKVDASDLVSVVSGESEEKIRELFIKASRTAPSIIFIDNIDAIASKRDIMQGQMKNRMVSQLITCMDGLVYGEDGSYRNGGHVLVIGATSRVDSLDLALRMPMRFEREIALGVPDEASRLEILSVVTRGLKVSALDLMKIVRSTSGFVGADLVALAKEAAMLAIKRTMAECSEQQKHGLHKPLSSEDMKNLIIKMTDFEEAVKVVKSSLFKGVSTIPNVKWDDVVGHDSLRQKFHAIVQHRKFPEQCEEIGLKCDTVYLLHGPPGCGKSMIAKAVAHEVGANFVHIKGRQLLAAKNRLELPSIFSRARKCSPCIIFIDEVDALTTKHGEEGQWFARILYCQLLAELDEKLQGTGVYVIGATERIDVIDPALLRPGKWGRPMHVPLPNPDERGMILKAICQKRQIDADLDFIALGKDSRLNNFSGADLSDLVEAAARASLGQTFKNAFEEALQELSPASD